MFVFRCNKAYSSTVQYTYQTDRGSGTQCRAGLLYNINMVTMVRGVINNQGAADMMWGQSLSRIQTLALFDYHSVGAGLSWHSNLRFFVAINLQIHALESFFA